LTAAQRSQLRRRLRAARRALTTDTARAHGRAVARHVATSSWLLAARRFAAYTPNDGELDPSDLIDRLLARSRLVALPVVLPDRQLGFYRYRPGTRLVRNRFGIPEPDTRTASFVPTRSLDLVFVPLVGFDARGHRLGMGGGYYDATFGRLEPRPLLVGLAHALQQVDRLAESDWDIPLDAVVTEERIIRCTVRGRR
jgi:5-formyltetrahydrofolate cyclo-ligase